MGRTHTDVSRRAFVQTGLVAGAAAALGPLPDGDPVSRKAPDPRFPYAAPPLATVRIGFVGVGGMGMVHVENLLHIRGAVITAVCDIVADKVALAQDKIAAAGLPRPRGYSRGPRDFERMCQEEDLDLVFTATPWEWHVPVCLAAMRAGKHAATEVPAAYTVDDCWDLVETAEKERRHCVMMENCCYGRSEMLMLNMVRQGLFGELLHGEGGYLHDLRRIKFSTEGEGLWRRAHAQRRNGNLYPTHGLGPIAQCMDINRGDRFEYLVSMSSNSRGLTEYAAQHFPEEDPRRRERFVLGDVNTALIRTARGRTIYLVHNTDNPRPYSRINLLQGTRGIFSGYPDRVHIEGVSPAHQWEPVENYYDRYEHPLWQSDEVRNETGGHGGMDFLEDRRLIECLLAGEPTDQNVYDAAAWSVITPLTESSVAHRSRSVEVPDFTRGKWRSMPPLGIISAPVDQPGHRQ